MFRCLFSAFVFTPSYQNVRFCQVFPFAEKCLFLFLFFSVASLSRLSIRVRCVPCLLARKCHKCHRSDKQAHFVGNRRASRAFLVGLNFSRFARTQRVCAFALCLSVFRVCQAVVVVFFPVSVSTVMKLSQI